MRILVVEDQATIAFMLAEQLTKAGHEVLGPAKSSREALQLAKDHELDIAVVDLDLERRAVGLDLTQQLTAERNLDVIICTGQPDLARRAPSGAIGLIRKPYDPKDVVASVSVIEALKSGAASPAFPHAFELLINPQ